MSISLAFIGLALLLAATTAATAEEQTMNLVFVRNATARLAVANDGSPAAFYVAPGSDPNLFLVHLEGGWWCSTLQSCSQRWASGQGMSSKNLSATWQTSGYYSRDCLKNVAWCSATMIRVPYLTSDGYVGDTAPSAALPWHFRGSRVLRAIFEGPSRS